MRDQEHRYIISKYNFLNTEENADMLERMCFHHDWDLYQWYDCWAVYIPEHERTYFEHIFGKFL